MEAARKVILVTGGARRVGRAIALHMAHAGYDVAFTYHRSTSEAQSLSEEIRQIGRAVLAIPADFSTPAVATEAVFAAVSKHFARLDVLVNNASVYRPASLHSSPADAGPVWEVHVLTPFLLCQRFESLLRASHGHVINMADLLAERPWPQYLLYSASKGALVSLTRGLARALAPDVTVNAIAPGVVQWPEDYSESDRSRYLKRVPLGRSGTPDDVARLVQFLATSAPYMTGQIISLDGGRSIT